MAVRCSHCSPTRTGAGLVTVPDGFGQVTVTEEMGPVVELPEGSHQSGKPVTHGQVQMFVCLRCSAIVADPPTHERYCPAPSQLWSPGAN